MRTLVVAEKPSVARDIARVLKAGERGEGCLLGEKYIVTWAVGHLVTLCEPQEIDESYKKWRMDALPMLPPVIPLKVIPATKPQYSIVKKLMNDREVDSLICATDSGREGELIFRCIYQMTGCKKPFRRLWISSMTDAAIKEGFDRLRPSSDYDALYESAKCRSLADWLVGMNASRAFSLRYDALLPIGRVQTPTLALIVARDAEIADFQPRDYFEVTADFGDYKGKYFDRERKECRVYDKTAAEKIKKEATGQTGVVTESAREQKSLPPPYLFDLTSLQREANRALGFSADKTLKLTQALYETHKLLTYPRTDSRRLPKDMIPSVEKTLRAMPEPYDALIAPLFQNPLTKTSRIYDDAKVTDHHAIVPTGKKPNLAALSADERAVFDMVTRRLIAVHYPDYLYESAKVITEVAGHPFLTQGATPVSLGWRALYPGDKPEDEPVPKLREGDTRTVKSVSVKAQKTKPPAPHTDASLLNLMEHAGQTIEDEALREKMKSSGLGTSATRAAMIEKLISSGYVARSGKVLRSTDKGKRLIAVVPEQIKAAVTTGKWEKALSDMAEIRDTETLTAKSDRFMAGIHRFAAFLVDAAKSGNSEIQFEKEAYQKRRPVRRAPAKPRKSAE